MYLLGDSPGRFLLQATTFFLKFWQLKTEMKHTLNENSYVYMLSDANKKLNCS